MDKKYNDILELCSGRATEDPKVRRELLTDANATVKKYFDVDLPFKVTFHDYDQHHLVFILPAEEDDQETELDLAALDNVAGGMSGASFAPTQPDGWGKAVLTYAAMPIFNSGNGNISY